MNLKVSFDAGEWGSNYWTRCCPSIESVFTFRTVLCNFDRRNDAGHPVLKKTNYKRYNRRNELWERMVDRKKNSRERYSDVSRVGEVLLMVVNMTVVRIMFNWGLAGRSQLVGLVLGLPNCQFGKRLSPGCLWQSSFTWWTVWSGTVYRLLVFCFLLFADGRRFGASVTCWWWPNTSIYDIMTPNSRSGHVCFTVRPDKKTRMDHQLLKCNNLTSLTWKHRLKPQWMRTSYVSCLHNLQQEHRVYIYCTKLLYSTVQLINH